MENLRFGVIGVGNMGAGHARKLKDRIPGATIWAVGDVQSERAESLARDLGCRAYGSPMELLAADDLDAVIVATPHFSHPELAIAALGKGLHVLVEKPMAVRVSEARAMLAAHRDKSRRFGVMLNQRTDGIYRRTKELLAQGELGKLRRVNWIITDWFRTEAYYRSAGWRATWAGEGGGVLVNQVPHQLDLLQWLTGMPETVRGFCSFGKYHDIEVEDDVTAYFDYPGGATGVFIASTGECPGTNRLELTGDMGRLIVEAGRITFKRNERSAWDFSHDCPDRMARVPHTESEVSFENSPESQHELLIRDFVESIHQDRPLLAPATEGVKQVELANAILQSGFTGQPVSLPLDAAAFDANLVARIASSRYQAPKAA